MLSNRRPGDTELHHLGKEAAREFFAGAVEERCGGAVLGDIAGGDEGDVVGDGAGESHLVSAEDDVLSGGGEFADEFENLRGHLWIQCGGGFVEDEDFRFSGNGAGEADTLLLTAGELCGKFVRMTGEAEAVEAFIGDAGGIGGGMAVHFLQGERHVAVSGEMREEVELLKEEAVAAAPCECGGFVTGLHTVDGEGAAVCRLQPADDTKKRALAASAGADEREDTGIRDMQIQRVQSGECAVVFCETGGVDFHDYIWYRNRFSIQCANHAMGRVMRR